MIPCRSFPEFYEHHATEKYHDASFTIVAHNIFLVVERGLLNVDEPR